MRPDYASRTLHPILADRLAAARTALVVVDMQNDFCAPGGYVATAIGKDVSGLAAIVAPIAAMLTVARAARIPVIWLLARYEEALLPPSMLAQKRRLGIEAVCCAQGSWGGDFFAVRPEPGDAVFAKSTYSGFSNPDLGRHLRTSGIEALVFCGVQTNVCVDSTLRDAHSRGFDVGIVSDAVGSHSPELHEATLANVGFLFGDVLAASDLLAVWRSPAVHP